MNLLMDLAVSDSDVLIHLSKLNQLATLKAQFSKIYVSDVIQKETIIQGIAQQKKDAFTLKDFFQSGLIFIERVKSTKILEIMKKFGIHEGEASIIVLAKEFKVSYCLVNEIDVRNIIKSEGFKVVGTLGIILKAYNIGTLNKFEALNLLKEIQSRLIEFRFHPKLIDKVIAKIKP